MRRPQNERYEKLHGNSCTGWRKCFVMACAILVASGTMRPASAGLLDGLVASYPFNGNANDESGNGNNGTPVGPTLVADRFGTVNSAYEFDGVDDHIEIPNASSLNGMTELTMSAWIKTTSGGVILDKSRSDGGFQYAMNLLDGVGNGVVFYFQGANHLAANAPSNLDDGEWHSIISTFKNNVEGKVYFDGVLSGTDNTPSAFAWNLTDTGSLTIGARSFTGSNLFFDGQIDDIRIYSRRLSQSEISALVPEPSTFLLAALGLLSLRYHGRRRR